MSLLLNDMVSVCPFLSSAQFAVMKANCRGEEGESFQKKFADLSLLIASMPVTYEQDGKGDEAVAYLHYFRGGSDWYITEKDMDGGVEQAFGYTILNGDDEMAECGYISISELAGFGVELDLHFAPRTIAKIKAERIASSSHSSGAGHRM